VVNDFLKIIHRIENKGLTRPDSLQRIVYGNVRIERIVHETVQILAGPSYASGHDFQFLVLDRLCPENLDLKIRTVCALNRH